MKPVYDLWVYDEEGILYSHCTCVGIVKLFSRLFRLRNHQYIRIRIEPRRR